MPPPAAILHRIAPGPIPPHAAPRPPPALAQGSGTTATAALWHRCHGAVNGHREREGRRREEGEIDGGRRAEVVALLEGGIEREGDERRQREVDKTRGVVGNLVWWAD